MLIDQIRQDMTVALKNGQKMQLETLRMLMSEINYKQIDTQKPLTDADTVGVIQKEVKKRREAIDSYTAGGRPEQAESEKEEMAVLEAYLPKQMTAEEVKAELKLMNLPNDFAQAMKMAAPIFKGRADGRIVAESVKELCQ